MKTSPPKEEVIEIRPQPGPQTYFLSSSADIAVYGGSAGSGKSYSLLMEPMRHILNENVKDFYCVFFRRTTSQVMAPGGLWDESQKLYSGHGIPRTTPFPEWTFDNGNRIRFAHLEHEHSVHNWQGSQVALLAFDELTSFTESQFFYMLSRNRSISGVSPYVRATTNPDSESWVARFISWWIDQASGLPIPERSGVLRYFIRLGNGMVWADTPEELVEHQDEQGIPIPPKSVTFIPAKLSDNQKLLSVDPGYYSNLLALGTVERERLLHGNWKIRPQGGMFFKRSWVEVVDAPPVKLKTVRGWDLGGGASDKADWTCGTKMGITPDKRIYVLDHIAERLTPHGVDNLILNTAKMDSVETEIMIPQDPAQAGISQRVSLSQKLMGFRVRFRPVQRSGNKITRFGPFSAQCEAGNVSVVRGRWNDRWFTELENFPPETKSGHDDDADATATAFDGLLRPRNYPASSRWSVT